MEIGDATRTNTKELDCECQNPKPPQCQCKFVPACPHAGGDPIHDTCADFVSNNVYPKCDVLVTTPQGQSARFDGQSADGTLWEMKTNTFSTYTKGLQWVTVFKNLDEAKYDVSIAHKCDRPYNFAVADQTHYDAFVKKGFLNIPDKLVLETSCLPTTTITMSYDYLLMRFKNPATTEEDLMVGGEFSPHDMANLGTRDEVRKAISSSFPQAEWTECEGVTRGGLELMGASLELFLLAPEGACTAISVNTSYRESSAQAVLVFARRLGVTPLDMQTLKFLK